CGDRDDPIVLLRLLDQALSKDLRIARWSGLALILRAGHHVEFGHAMIFVSRILGRGIALALLRHAMDENRPDIGIADIAKHGQEMIEIMPVDGADIINTELLE